MPKKHARIWIARPNHIIRAQTPEDLAHQRVVVHPWSLTELWGEDAASRYMKAMGMTDQAIRESIDYHKKSGQPEQD